MSHNLEESPGDDDHRQSQPTEAEQGISRYGDRADSDFVQRPKNTDGTLQPSKDKESLRNKKSPEPRKFYLVTHNSGDDERHRGSESSYSYESVNLEQPFRFGEFNTLVGESLPSLSTRDSTSAPRVSFSDPATIPISGHASSSSSFHEKPTTVEPRGIPSQLLPRASSITSFGFIDDGEDTIISWEENDPENPYNWSSGRKAAILLTAVMLILNSSMGSALPSNAIPFIVEEWKIESEQETVLPISIYLIGEALQYFSYFSQRLTDLGYVMGPILWAPLSEQYGRRRLSIGTFAMFTLFTLACALAPHWISFIIFRLFSGIFASAPIALVPGIIADIYNEPRQRGRSMGIFMATTVFGPLIAPIISGYAATTIGWRWAFWIGLMYAGLTLLPLFFLLPETYGPILLLRRAQHLRLTNPNAHVVAPRELEDTQHSLSELTTIVLTRPIRMILMEPIVSTSCAYISLCYAIFYMTFEAYPFIFIDLYGLTPGQCGLTYLAIGVGCLIALPIFMAWDSILTRARHRNAPWTRQEEYRRLPLACLGGPMFVVSLFWLGFTSRFSVPFWIPMLSGIPFGMGFMCVFQALLNYLTDAYEIFAASANAAASCSRSLLATLLPLATAPMFHRLGIAGACSLLGGLSLLMTMMPFIFLWQGEKIRRSSKFCLLLRERREEMERKIEEQKRRRTGIMMTIRMSGVPPPASSSAAVAAAAGLRFSAYGEGMARTETRGEAGRVLGGGGAMVDIAEEEQQGMKKDVEKGMMEMDKGKEMEMEMEGRKSSSSGSNYSSHSERRCIQAGDGRRGTGDVVNHVFECPDYEGADEVGESSFSHDHDPPPPGSGSRSGGSSATVAVSPPPPRITGTPHDDDDSDDDGGGKLNGDGLVIGSREGNERKKDE
ncbi:MFS general substrate transporter [Neurospora crassa]|uniref:Membrane transporter n=1 Tax=Neurospora crassa (strain ATCC 24698 / 74-OR23-1A / CBS 708.71 / DSM 1257 / FGSC 987) TaxID=367110 RepID=Q7RY09_NEUCR|nr:membrane transporter [Neurospora crassa OR74A]EAA27613.3 membrane transporter [Neurospora crassa OR74A]KHE86408.1 MFS general substrate transporter [Neurospora crassa]|eukprot:XP_956849.3 membrane transporter [Neurospora crassa OR74A]